MADENPLRPICKQWLEKIKLAEKHKKPFSEDADEAMAFFCSDPDAMWGGKYFKNYSRGIDPPEFRMQVNRVWEAVRLFTAVIHHRNPTRTVTPKRPWPSSAPIRTPCGVASTLRTIRGG